MSARLPEGRHEAGRLSGFALTVVLSAVFMGQFDFFVVNVAAPSLQRDLAAGEIELELIVGGYAFAYAAGLVLGGRIGDLWGRRRMFVIGTIAFAVASGLCGLAVSPGQLIAARLAQGLAAAAMLPQALGMISQTGSQRPVAMAWFGVAGGTGSIAGQVLGGLMISGDIADLGWRPIFLVAVPVGIAAAALAFALPGDDGPHHGRSSGLDPLGAGGLALSLGLVLVPLAMGRAEGWPLWTILCPVAAVPAFCGTWWWQRFLERHGGAPLLAPSLFRADAFGIGLAANGAFMAYFAAYMFTLTLLLQRGLGLDPLGAGLAFVPGGVAFAGFALLAPHTNARFGIRSVVVGCGTSVVGLAGLAGVAAVGPDAPLVAVVACVGVISAGNGLVMPSLIGAALQAVPARQSGAAGGLLTTTQQFGGAAGVAVLGTVYFALTPWGHSTAMPVTAAACAVLVAVVAILVVVHERRAAVSATAEPSVLAAG